MNGALPPSSIEERMTCCDACSRSFTPTAVEPVNETLRARPLLIHGSTTEPASEEHTTLRTPAGRPASTRMSTRAKLDNGVRWAGLKTIVQPAAMAGPILRVAMASGKFHGVTSTHGPIGWRDTKIRVKPSPESIMSPPMRTASSENHRKNSAA